MRIKALLKKEIKTELRQPAVAGGIVLYLVATAYICYLAFTGEMDEDTWNAILWMLILFTTINAVFKSFSGEESRRWLYYHTLVTPGEFIISKMIYNALVVSILALVSYVLLALLLHDPVVNLTLFLTGLTLGAIGLSMAFTFTAAIASKTSMGYVLIAILGIPLIMPIILVMVSLTWNAIHGISWESSLKFIIALICLDVIQVVLAVILFPYLWKD